jgi:threonine dehydrogenase-like Zn-dependent dehydrogenase
MSRVVVCGSLNMDVVVESGRRPHAGETLLGAKVSFLPGGKGLNQAIAAARLGGSTAMMGAIGHDAFGNTLRGFVVFATLLGLFTLAWGYRRHRAVRALWLLFPGLALLWLATGYEPLHHAVVPHAIAMTLGGTLVGLAHLANLRLNHGHVHDAHCAH